MVLEDGFHGLLKGLQEAGLQGHVPHEAEEEQVLEALEGDGAQRGQAQQQRGEAPLFPRTRTATPLLQARVHLRTNTPTVTTSPTACK